MTQTLDSPACVLIVEDDEAHRRTLVDLLAHEGYEAAGCADVEEAKSLLSTRSFAVAVVDEGLAGRSLLHHMHHFGCATNVILSTAYDSLGSAADSGNSGAFAYAHKAGDPRELINQVHRAVVSWLGRELSRYDEHLSRIYDSAHDGILTIDPRRGVVLECNPRVEEILGYETRELVGCPSRRLHPGEADPILDLGREILRADRDQAQVSEAVCRRRDGSEVPVEFSASSLTRGGKPVLLVLLRDLSDRVQADQARREGEARLGAIFAHSPASLNLKDEQGRYLIVNHDFATAFGLEPSAVRGKLPEDIYPPDIARVVRAHDLEVLRGGRTLEQECVLFKTPEPRTYIVVKFPIRDPEGNICGVGSIGTDITSRKEAEAALALSEERFQGLYDNAPDMYFTLSSQGEIASVNQFGADYLGYRKDELMGSFFWDLVFPDDMAAVRRGIEAALERGVCDAELQFRMLRRDATKLWVHQRMRVLAATDSGPAELRIICRDVTEAHDLSERLSYQATHDALTGLVNRPELERRLGRILETARSHDSEHALCYLDLDQFKVINDTCGHVAGDALLRQLGDLLPGQVRRRDTLARLGGDEFAVLMENCTLPQARRVADALRQAVEGLRFAWGEKTFAVGVSVGLVPINASSDSVAGVLSKADTACYMAKDQGRNRVHVYRQDDIELTQRTAQMQWVSRLTAALEDDRFCLSFQPIRRMALLNSDEGEGSGQWEREAGDHFELLLRMRDESGRLISPGAFLPAAERYGLSVKLDRWVIARAFQWLNTHPEQLGRLALCSINLSGHSLADEEFLQFVITKFDETAVPAENICFEITETAAISNLTSATRFMTALKGWGCRFALDDFGSGLSSFAYLKHLDVDFLKIDGVFVKDIATDPISLAMVRSINEIGQVMGKRTIAEFVQDEAILEELRRVGVDYVQGYTVGRPQSLELISSPAVHRAVSG